ncbi:MAG: hypothetical protein GF320_09820 [Armatimonadia bacterium]|nr:hypothetical protein [Armatimonadia bacterium]
MTTLWICTLCLALLLASAAGADWTVEPAGEGDFAGAVTISGVSAGEFDPLLWSAGTLNLKFDARHPLLEPREGPLRNIYAPMAIREPDGWRLYYGAWDGVETGNDRIYTAWTEDFLGFADRRTVIEHGPFIHVCNCCVIKLPSGEYRMVATAYPHQPDGQNRPIGFQSEDGLHWEGDLPHVAEYDDLLTIEGYPNWSNADINGMNALMYEDGLYRLYFGDFQNFGTVYRATSEDFETYQFDGPALSEALAVNDVKRLDVDGDTWYLMGLHMNRGELRYALSQDGMEFEPSQLLIESRSDADAYIVAIGWVVDGQRVLGALYGAGAVRALNENRLFATWLQKRVVFETEDGIRLEGQEALGPDRVLLGLDEPVRGRFLVYAEDGQTLIGKTPRATLRPGQTWRVSP